MNEKKITYVCLIKECDRGVYAGGICRGHYQRYYLTRSFLEGRVGFNKGGAQGIKKCTVVNCNIKIYAKKLCLVHYNLKRYGSEARPEQRKCDIPDCKLLHASKGMCRFHYIAMKARGFNFNIMQNEVSNDE